MTDPSAAFKSNPEALSLEDAVKLLSTMVDMLVAHTPSIPERLTPDGLQLLSLYARWSLAGKPHPSQPLHLDVTKGHLA